MAADLMLALDLGTSSARCLLCRANSTPLAVVRQPYHYASTDGLPQFARQFDPQGMARLLEDLIGQVLATGGVSADRVAAVGVTSQREGFAALDRRGRDLYLGPNLDLRAVFQGAAIDQEHAGRIYRTTGHLPSFFFVPAKLLWLKENAPALFGRIARVVSLAAWAVHRLTGEMVDEPALQGEAGLLDIRRRKPAASLLRLLGLDPSWLPPAAPAGTVCGRVTTAVAKRTGLRPETPVTLAGPDAHSGLLGMGVTAPGHVGIVAGWSAPVQMVRARPVFDRLRRTWTECHVVPGRWLLEASPGDTGNAFEQVRALVAPSTDHEALYRLAEKVPAGACGVVAFVGPRPLDLARPGLLPGGLLFPAPLTYQEMRPEHLVRATLENIGYALRACLERVEAIAQTRAEAVHLGGGMAASPVFARLVADILNRPVAHHAAEVSGIGAALCAAVAAGHLRDLEEAAATAGERHTPVEPDAATAAEYEGLYRRWCRLRRGVENLKEVIE